MEELRRFTITGIEGEIKGPATETVRSEYVEEYWLQYIGPAALLIARKIDLILSNNHKSQVDIPKWAAAMKITPFEFLAACNTLVDWGFATWSDRDPTLFMLRHWPPVPAAVKTPRHREALINLPPIVPV